MEELGNFVKIKENDWGQITEISKIIQPTKNCCDTSCKTEICKNIKNRVDCSSDHNCENHEKFRKQIKKVYIKTTPKCGFGLFAGESIEKGQFIIEYIGKVREDDDQFFAKYCFDLTENLVIDSYEFGNEARFINHSCDPNAASRRWFSNNGKPSIEILAKRDIKENEEITMSYGYVPAKNHERCHCGSQNCSKLLGVSPEYLYTFGNKNEGASGFLHIKIEGIDPGKFFKKPQIISRSETFLRNKLDDFFNNEKLTKKAAEKSVEN